MSALNFHLTSFAENPTDQLAKHIASQQQSNLPFLSTTFIFTPHANIAAELRYKLLLNVQGSGIEGLVGPEILSFHQWLKAFQPKQLQVVSSTTQELILVEALQQQQNIFHSVNPWIYANSLLELFQELTINKITIPDNEQDFITLLTEAYGIHREDQEATLHTLSQEAHLVFTLWHAWHTQLSAYNVVDTQTAQLLSMKAALAQLENIEPQHFYFLGYGQMAKSEIQWLEQIASRHNVHFFLQADKAIDNKNIPPYHPDNYLLECLEQFSDATIHSNPKIDKNPKTQFINSVYVFHTAPLQQRFQSFEQASSPLENFHVYSANDEEQQARAIDIQLRRWLLQGKTKLAIVTENRRLARRVRALLERSGVHLQDSAGWALSTTRAAALLERWLECIESDFHYLALLDLLKSSFIFPDIDRQTLHYAIYRLEQDIIRHENIHQGIASYQSGILKRKHRLPGWFDETHTIVNEILDTLEQAAQPLRTLYQSETCSPILFIDTLLNSLSQLGLQGSLESDAAGIKIITLLQNLQVESELVTLNFKWSEARAWLASHLEKNRFLPPSSATQVQLIGLSQSQFQTFDGLIIAAVEEEFLPGSSAPSVFFNNAVRSELALPTSLQQKNERFYHFTRLLNTTDNILLTYRKLGDNGETIRPSAWLALIEQFHQLAFDSTLDDSELIALVNAPENTFSIKASHKAKEISQPVPRLPENIIPSKITASQYQELINCPYLFFAARCLQLEATEEMRQALSKADYGERIHQCLQAFHSQVDGLPAPFKKKITEHNRTAAIKHLSKIVAAVFDLDLQENHEHQAWYTQARQIVPHYINWQIAHNCHWDIFNVETNITTELPLENTHKTLNLSGRLDRIDKSLPQQQDSSLAIIDYKTGSISSNKDVEAGEQVQLPFYRTLLQDTEFKVSQVEYLEIKTDSVKSRGKLSEDKLEEIATESTTRLKEIFSQLHGQKGAPAWGDETTCQRCHMQGICRKQMWQD